MRYPEAPLSKVQYVLRSLHEHRRLATVVRTMAQEIERLHEDNAQLRAAVSIYREVALRANPQTFSGS